MDFEQKKRISSNQEKYHIENLKLTREFSKNLIQEMDNLVKSIVLFGSNTHDTTKKTSDIDLMIVLDNVSVFVTPELREAYKIITQNLSEKISNKLHIMTVNLTDLWDMARKGDPLLINILRFGLPVFDRDLVEPLQYLLEIGRIKPSRETVYNYMARAQTLHEETTKHLDEAILDLYYSTVDMVHATLILQKVMPPSPKEMPKIFKKTFKNNAKILKHAKTIDELYSTAKDIEHHKITPTGVLYDKLKKKADILLTNLSQFNDEQLKKKDNFEL